VSGKAARDEAIARVERNADTGFYQDAIDAVNLAALAYPEFTTEEVVRLLADRPAPHEPRVFGAVMRRAAEAGWITPTDRWALSTFRRSHSRPKRIWSSLIYQPDPQR
jgi:hypothetical protein